MAHRVSEPTSPIQIADFRRLWLTRFLGAIATNGMVVILGYQLYDVARSAYGMSIAEAAFQLGLLGLVQFVPLALLTPVAGVVADRIDRRHVGAMSIGMDLLVAFSLALATYLGWLSLPLLFVLAALHGSARVFLGPSLTAIAPNIVPAALIPRAIALSGLSWTTGSITGPAIAGLLYASNAAFPYWGAMGLLAMALLTIVSIRPLPPHEGARAVHPIRQMIEGFSYIRGQRFLQGCITLDLFAVLLGGATALLPVFARDVLHVGSEGLGIMRAAPSIGAAGVAILLAWRPFASNVGVKMLWAVAGFGLATICFGLTRDFVASLVFLAAIGATDMISVFIRNSLVQLNTPDEMRGRVGAISGLAISASNELGEMQSGVAAALLGATGAVVFGGAGAIVVTLIWAWKYPEIRNARTFAPQYREQ